MEATAAVPAVPKWPPTGRFIAAVDGVRDCVSDDAVIVDGDGDDLVRLCCCWSELGLDVVMEGEEEEEEDEETGETVADEDCCPVVPADDLIGL